MLVNLSSIGKKEAENSKPNMKTSHRTLRNYFHLSGHKTFYYQREVRRINSAVRAQSICIIWNVIYIVSFNDENANNVGNNITATFSPMKYVR